MRIIKLEAHDEQWCKDFEHEVSFLKAVLKQNLVAAFQIGSTAIARIRAKPVIDILLEVGSLHEVDKHNRALEELGYEAKGEYGIQGRRFFQKGDGERTHHLHMFQSGDPEIERHRLFIAFMNAHPDKAAEYEKLKIALSTKYKERPEKYSQGKSAFIHAIDAEAIKWKNG